MIRKNLTKEAFDAFANIYSKTSLSDQFSTLIFFLKKLINLFMTLENSQLVVSFTSDFISIDSCSVLKFIPRKKLSTHETQLRDIKQKIPFNLLLTPIKTPLEAQTTNLQYNFLSLYYNSASLLNQNHQSYRSVIK